MSDSAPLKPAGSEIEQDDLQHLMQAAVADALKQARTEWTQDRTAAASASSSTTDSSAAAASTSSKDADKAAASAFSSASSAASQSIVSSDKPKSSGSASNATAGTPYNSSKADQSPSTPSAATVQFKSFHVPDTNKVEWKRDREAEKTRYTALASIANGLFNFQAKFLPPKFCNDQLIQEFNDILETTQEEMDTVLVAGTAKHGWHTSACLWLSLALGNPELQKQIHQADLDLDKEDREREKHRQTFRGSHGGSAASRRPGFRESSGLHSHWANQNQGSDQSSNFDQRRFRPYPDPSQGRSPHTPRQASSRDLCFLCRKPGHFKAQCPSKGDQR